jgi:hypothetical protein
MITCQTNLKIDLLRPLLAQLLNLALDPQRALPAELGPACGRPHTLVLDPECLAVIDDLPAGDSDRDTATVEVSKDDARKAG